MKNQNLFDKSFKRSQFPHASHGRLISSTDSNDCSTKQEAVKQAEVLGVSVKTINYWLTKYVQSNEIQRIMNGKYQKTKGEIA